MQRITLDSEISYIVTEKELNEIRADERSKTIKEIEEKLNEVYQMNAYCAEDYCTEDGISCDSCLKVKIYQVLEKIKAGDEK